MRTRRAFTLVEVMVSAAFFTLVAAGILSTFVLTLKTQKKASCQLSIHALANSITDQVCGTGYTEVNEWVLAGPAGRKLVVAVNDPVTGKQLPVPVVAGERLRLDGKTEVDCPGQGFPGDRVRLPALKLDYSLHHGAAAGGTFTMQNLATATGIGYSEIPGLSVTVRARKPAGTAGAYLVDTTAEYTDPFGRPASVSVARLVSNLAGYAHAN